LRRLASRRGCGSASPARVTGLCNIILEMALQSRWWHAAAVQRSRATACWTVQHVTGDSKPADGGYLLRRLVNLPAGHVDGLAAERGFTARDASAPVRLMQLLYASWSWLCCAPGYAMPCVACGILFSALEYCAAVVAICTALEH
jgi:hypothetical protein